MRDRELMQMWQMAAVGALAGGQSHKQAVEAAEKVTEAFKARFPTDRDDDD